MEIEDLSKINKVVGLRQVVKSLNANRLSQIVLATDADEDFAQKILCAAKEKNVPVNVVGTKVSIAKVCGVDRIVTVVGVLQ